MFLRNQYHDFKIIHMLFLDFFKMRLSTIFNISFDSDLVWRMQLMIIKGQKFVLCE